MGILGSGTALTVGTAVVLSIGSAMEEPKTLFFKLDEEKFFFSNLELIDPLPFARPGESGADRTLSKLSDEVTFVRPPGVVGIAPNGTSLEPGVGNGDDPFRSLINEEADGFKTRLGCPTKASVDGNADRGGSTRLGAMGGGIDILSGMAGAEASGAAV